MIKAVIYTRFSTRNQDESSLEDQERRCRAFAASKDLDVTGVYADPAVSGTTTRRDDLGFRIVTE